MPRTCSIRGLPIHELEKQPRPARYEFGDGRRFLQLSPRLSRWLRPDERELNCPTRLNDCLDGMERRAEYRPLSLDVAHLAEWPPKWVGKTGHAWSSGYPSEGR